MLYIKRHIHISHLQIISYIQLDLPFLTTVVCRIKKIMIFKPLCLHPVFIVTTSHAVQLVDQIWEVLNWMRCFRTPIMFSNGRCKWTMLGCAREVYRPWKWWMRVLAIFQARRGSWIVLVTAFLGGTIDLKVVWLMQLRFTVPTIYIKMKLCDCTRANVVRYYYHSNTESLRSLTIPCQGTMGSPIQVNILPKGWYV